MTEALVDTKMIAQMLPELVAIRRDLHANPELGFRETRTSSIVSAFLRLHGLQVATGLGGTGVVGTLKRGTSPRTIGFRADMDALPMQEEGTSAHASTVPGVFHGCGHDGHTAMLLGAARYLSEASDFDGTVHFIFQPAEEGLGGAKRMVEEGLFEQFPCDFVFGLHNWPDLPAGTFQTRTGAIMAAADRFDIVLTGKGGHAAQPQNTPDAVLAAAWLVSQLNTLVGRRLAPSEQVVLSVTKIEGGETHSAMPARVRLTGTVRTLNGDAQDTVEHAIRNMAAGVATSSGIEIDVSYIRYYPATVNDPTATAKAFKAARSVSSEVREGAYASLAAEDFSFMLQRRPGAYIWLGQGSDMPVPLHNPKYDFNDEIMGSGIAWYAALAMQNLTR